jgi:hypothetical protein
MIGANDQFTHKGSAPFCGSNNPCREFARIRLGNDFNSTPRYKFIDHALFVSAPLNDR